MNPFDKYCCETAKQQITYSCKLHGDDCPDQLLKYCEGIQEGEGGMNISPELLLVARNAAYRVDYCPWCGTKITDFYKLSET